MIIFQKLKGIGSRSSLDMRRSVGMWAAAILCGSVAVACSGTIETPSEEFPPRQGRQAADDDDDGAQSTASASNRPATASANDDDDDAPRPPAASDDDDDDDQPAAGDDPADEDPEEEDPAAEAPAGGVSFASDVQPIFNARCGPCHVSQGIIHNIGSDDLDEALQDSIDFEDAVIAELESGDMPLGCGGPPGSGGNCVTEDEFTTIEDWYAAGTPE